MKRLVKGSLKSELNLHKQESVPSTEKSSVSSRNDSLAPYFEKIPPGYLEIPKISVDKTVPYDGNWYELELPSAGQQALYPYRHFKLHGDTFRLSVVLIDGGIKIVARSYDLHLEHQFDISADGGVSESCWRVCENHLVRQADIHDIIGPHNRLLRLLPGDVQVALRPYFGQSKNKSSATKDDIVGQRNPKARVLDFRADRR